MQCFKDLSWHTWWFAYMTVNGATLLDTEIVVPHLAAMAEELIKLWEARKLQPIAGHWINSIFNFLKGTYQRAQFFSTCWSEHKNGPSFNFSLWNDEHRSSITGSRLSFRASCKSECNTADSQIALMLLHPSMAFSNSFDIFFLIALHPIRRLPFGRLAIRLHTKH